MASRRWYFHGPKEDEWFAYGESDASVLEAAYSSDPRGKHLVQLGPRKFLYEVDLVAMVQRNTKTGIQRLIKVQEEPAVGTKEIADIFAHIDKKGDGRLSKEELTEVLSELGMARSAVRTLLMAADTDRSGDLDYRKFVAWICGGSDIAKEVSSRFASRRVASDIVTVGNSSRACAESSQAGDMLVLQNRDGHSTVFIHPPDGHSASLKVPNGTLTRKVRERGDSWVVKYDGEDWLVKKHHALEAARDVGQAAAPKMAGKGRGKARRFKGVSCDPSIVAGAAAVCKVDWCPDETMECWKRFNGRVLETALTVVEELGESPVRLVDARFIVELAKRGGILPRRQDLPEECFISLEQLKRFPRSIGARRFLRIVAISHPWQQPDHPDPKGINLQILAGVLSIFMKDQTFQEEGGTYAVFLDFLSVPQKGPNLEDRTPEEWSLFTLALTNMMDWYGHLNVLTFKITKLPDGYPSSFDFPEGCDPNTAGYFDRGWCFCESSVSNLAKSSEHVLDLGKLSGTKTNLKELVEECRAQRRPPISTQQFTLELSTKMFTSRAADEKKVSNLYKNAFKAQLGTVRQLVFYHLAWGDEEVAVLAQTLAAEALPTLDDLRLNNNLIGDAGCAALAKAFAAGTLPNFTHLCLDYNQIGDGGCISLVEAIAAGGPPNLKTLNLSHNQIGDGGSKAVEAACAAGALPKLKVLYLEKNRIQEDCFVSLRLAWAAQHKQWSALNLDYNPGHNSRTYQLIRDKLEGKLE